VVLLVRLVDLGAVGRLLVSADIGLVLVAVLLALADRAFMIGKWMPLVRVQVPDLPLVEAARAYLAASFASLFLPSSVGADVLRTVALGRGRGEVVEIGASVVSERLLGMVASGVLSCVALAVAVHSGVRLAFLVPWALTSIIVSGGALAIPMSQRVAAATETVARRLRGRRWIDWVGRFGHAYLRYRHRPGMLAVVGTLSVVEQLLPIAVLFTLAVGLRLSITIPMLVVAVPLTLFVSRLPLTFWGLGVTEGAMVYLLGLHGVAPSDALALSLAGRAVELAAVLPGAFLWRALLTPGRARRVNRSGPAGLGAPWNGGFCRSARGDPRTASPRTRGDPR
jgi:uncharacterized protein (TIRG00374 family)